MARPIKNNAEYFPHMAKMRDDQRLKSVRRQFGLEGYAVYCMLLESLTDAADFSIPVDDIALELLADDFGLELDRLRGVLECFRRLKLIEWTDKRIYCPKLVQYLDPLIEERRRKREWAEQKKQKDVPQVPENQTEREFSTSKTPNIKIKDKDKSKRTKKKGLAAVAANGQNDLGKPENETGKKQTVPLGAEEKKETASRGRAAKKPKPPAAAPALVTRLREVFEEEHQRHFPHKFPWTGRDFKALESLGRNMAQQYRDFNHTDTATDEQVANTFRAFLQRVASAAPWYLRNCFTPAGLSGQYSNLLNKFSHANASQPAGSTADEILQHKFGEVMAYLSASGNS